MRKRTKELRGKALPDLKKEVNLLREEIAKKTLHSKINPDKNTNTLYLMKKKLAHYLTIVTEKEEIQKLKKD